MQCPTCKSDTIKKIKLIYEEGTSKEVSSTDTTLRGDFFSSASSTTTHTSKTMLAKKYSPPREPYPSIFFHIFAAVLAIMVLNNLMPASIANIGAAAKWVVSISVFLLIYVLRYRLWSKALWERYGIDIKKWRNSWMCHKCGETFELTP